VSRCGSLNSLRELLFLRGEEIHCTTDYTDARINKFFSAPLRLCAKNFLICFPIREIRAIRSQKTSTTKITKNTKRWQFNSLRELLFLRGEGFVGNR